MVFLQKFAFTDFDVFKGSSETYVTTLKAAATTLSPTKLRWEAYSSRSAVIARFCVKWAASPYLFDEMGWKPKDFLVFFPQCNCVQLRRRCLNLKWLLGALIRLTVVRSVVTKWQCKLAQSQCTAPSQNIENLLEHAFQEKKSQSQNSIQHFEFSRTFLVLVGQPFCPPGLYFSTASTEKMQENSKCCIKFWLWDFFFWYPCSKYYFFDNFLCFYIFKDKKPASFGVLSFSRAIKLIHFCSVLNDIFLELLVLESRMKCAKLYSP